MATATKKPTAAELLATAADWLKHPSTGHDWQGLALAMAELLKPTVKAGKAKTDE